jgi:hypothetical protein
MQTILEAFCSCEADAIPLRKIIDISLESLVIMIQEEIRKNVPGTEYIYRYKKK